MPKREWDELDEQMAREAMTMRRGFQSTGRPKGNRPSREKLLPGKARVPMQGSGAGDNRLSLGQTLWATNYSS